MPKVQLTPKQILQFIILGIQRGNYEAAIDIAQECIDQMDKEGGSKCQNLKNKDVNSLDIDSKVG